jgi:cytochrome c biogenesis protein
MTKKQNAVWQFLASVKLALFTLFTLAATSIIGTVIEQKKAPAFYVETYGPELARLMQLLDLPNMYGSWWFIALLALFALNLVVCSIERLPGAWHMAVQDNLATDPAQLEKMSSTHRLNADMPVDGAAERLQRILALAGWKTPRRLDIDGTTLLFAQKGAWSRFSVYLVHLSILIILAGAMLGSAFGFKAYVYLPEGRATTNVYLQENAEPVSLGFELHCDRAERSYYPNGRIREYRSDLTVIDSERAAPYQKSIIVNDPLTWRGITFYQGDFHPLDEFFIVIRSLATGREQAFRVPPDRDVAWQGTDVSFRIEELRREEDGTVRQVKISFADAAAEPAVFWMNDRSTVTVTRPEQEFTLSFRQLSSTLLLVTKDPGVWVVYLGSILMLVGLGVCFLLSHRRLWVYITPKGNRGSRILVSGASNKNKPTFERRFQDLVDRVQQELSAPTEKKK